MWFYRLSRRLIRDKRLCFGLLIVVGLVYILFSMEAIEHMQLAPVYRRYSCDMPAARSIVENLCDLHVRERHVIGTLCSDLCRPGVGDRYELVDCYSPAVRERNPAGAFDRQQLDLAKTVLVFERRGRQKGNDSASSHQLPRRFVLKSSKRSFLDFDYRSLDFDLDQKPLGRQLELLVNHLDSVLKRSLGVGLDRDAFHWLRLAKRSPERVLAAYRKSRNLNKRDMFHYVHLLAPNHEDFARALELNSQSQLAAFINNLAVLVAQEEYLFYKYFEAKPGVLHVLGTCGNFYAVEHARSLGHLVRAMNVTERKLLALKFLDLFKALDSIYVFKERQEASDNATLVADLENENDLDLDEKIVEQRGSRTVRFETEPMQMCDVKLDNFGLNERGELKLIDTDMVHPDSYLFSPRVCSSHDDCHYFDCKSYCEPTTRRCLARRVNNNLQALCEKIFRNAVNVADGVLAGVPSDQFGANIEYELVRRLELCAAPELFNSTPDIRSAASPSLYRVFQILLTDSTHTTTTAATSNASLFLKLN